MKIKMVLYRMMKYLIKATNYLDNYIKTKVKMEFQWMILVTSLQSKISN